MPKAQKEFKSEEQMAHTSLYRKYRPGIFGDVLGQEHVVSVLKGALHNGVLTHAYLFAGPRGTGKTSIARIFVREVGCSPIDIYEIDAASNRGIDDIRALREEVRTLPFESPKKAYIIDEVHMLTKESFNALLKTLEEPPAHALFVLATTELHKVPETIISRCQTFSFKKPALDTLEKMVTNVAKKEGYAIEGDAARLIAILGDGSFRDTHGILQKVISANGGGDITSDHVSGVTGAPRSQLVRSVFTALLGGDKENGFRALAEAHAESIDMKLFARLLSDDLRLALLMKVAPGSAQPMMEKMSPADVSALQGVIENISPKQIADALRAVLAAYEETDHAAIPTLPLELALASLHHA